MHQEPLHQHTEKPKAGTAPKLSTRNEHTLVKAVLLAIVQNFLQETITKSHKNFTKESYDMDKQIISLVIQSITDTGEYTLEGIAYYTKIPFDVIYEAAYGNARELTITPWSRIVALFCHVRPDVAQLLINKLLHTLGKDRGLFNALLNLTDD
jgi:hypothetical protein